MGNTTSYTLRYLSLLTYSCFLSSSEVIRDFAKDASNTLTVIIVNNRNDNNVIDLCLDEFYESMQFTKNDSHEISCIW